MQYFATRKEDINLSFLSVFIDAYDFSKVRFIESWIVFSSNYDITYRFILSGILFYIAQHA